MLSGNDLLNAKSCSNTDSWPFPLHWGAFLLVLSVIAAVGIWLLLSDHRAAPPPQAAITHTVRDKNSPVATQHSIVVVVGETRKIDVREYTSDPGDEILRLLSLESSRFGKVEQIDDYHFRYLAPSRKG